MPEYEKKPDSTRALKVWAQLAEMFGKAFYREHGDEPAALWQQAISRLSDTQLVRGLANIANDGLEFPPNLPQFLAACKRLPPVRHLGVPCLPLDTKAEAAKAWEHMERLAGRPLRPDGEEGAKELQMPGEAL